MEIAVIFESTNCSKQIWLLKSMLKKNNEVSTIQESF